MHTWNVRITIVLGALAVAAWGFAFTQEVFNWYPQPPTVFWLPVVLTGAAIVGWVLTTITAGRRDSETRCRACGHILRGLSEPRCPECGEPI